MEEVAKMKEKLFYNKENANLKLSEELLSETKVYCEDYKEFLNNCKTKKKNLCLFWKTCKRKRFWAIFQREKI